MTFKTIVELQEDDYKQSHRNIYESVRSVYERSTSITFGDDFTTAQPQVLNPNAPFDFVCNGNISKVFNGVPGQSTFWDTADNTIIGLEQGGTYFVIVGFQLKGTSNEEVIGELIDASDGVTVIAAAVPLDSVTSQVYHHYQTAFVFRAPAGVDGKKYKITLTFSGSGFMGERSVTVHRDR